MYSVACFVRIVLCCIVASCSHSCLVHFFYNNYYEFLPTKPVREYGTEIGDEPLFPNSSISYIQPAIHVLQMATVSIKDLHARLE